MRTQTHNAMTLANDQTFALAKTLNTRSSQLAAVCCFLLALLMLTMVVPTAHAQVFTPIASAAQIMLQTQSDNAAFLAKKFGVDPNSNLQFATYIDALGENFAFTLQPGSTYLGQPITMNVTGTFDSRSKTWKVSSAGSLAGDNWTVTSSLTISVGETAELQYVESQSELDSNMQILDITDINCNGVWHANNQSGGKTLVTYGHSPCVGYYYGQKVWVFSLAFNVKSGNDRNSTWSSYGNSLDGSIGISSSGFYPVDGGRGSFSQVIATGQQGCISCGNNSDSN